MSGTRSQSRAAAVSDSHPPILIPGRRVRSHGAALVGGSPLSSPVPSSPDVLSPLGRPSLESLECSLTRFPFQQASSQGEGHLPSTSAAAVGRAQSLGVALEEVKRSSPARDPSVNDVVMESTTERELCRTLNDIRARLPLPMGKVEKAVDEAKAKIHATSSQDGIVSALHSQFQPDVREYLKGYKHEVEVLAVARSTQTKLHKHRVAKTFPTSMNSIKAPSIQFSGAFINAPADDGVRGSYKLAPEAEHSNFELSVERAIRHVKEKILEDWISEKDREVDFLERKASVAATVTQLQEVVTKKHGQLKGRYDYLQGSPTYNDVIRDVDSFAAMTHALAMTIITKVNSLVLDEEDKRLAIAVKKMTLAKPAKEAAVQGPKNELTELKKMMDVLTKKVDAQSGKVSTALYSLLCTCVGHLSLTPPFLESLLIEIVKAGWEEVGRQQEEGEEGQVRAHRKTKGQES